MEDRQTTQNAGEHTTNNLDKQQEIEEQGIITSIQHYACEVSNELMAKIDAIGDLLLQLKPTNTIIYCNNRSETEVVEKIIRRKGVNARRVTYDLSQFQTTRILEKIAAGQLPVLVAVDFLKQNLNNKEIDLVINYALPENSSDYLKSLEQLNPTASVVNIVGAKDFGSFYTLKKSLSQLEFKELELGLLADASLTKLNILHSILRNIQSEIRSSDLEVAQSFLDEYGLNSVQPEFVEVMARVCLALTEYAFPDKVVSLEEELAGEDPSLKQLANDKGSWNSSSNNEEDNFRGARRFDRRSRFDENRGGNRGRGWRRDDDRKFPKERRAREDDSRNSDRRYGSGRRRFENDNYGKGQFKGRSPNRRGEFTEGEGSTIYDLRLYIGQGTNSGLTENEFKQLATSIGDIEASKIVRLKLHEHYGFIDVKEDAADTLVNNLNGIEYNGAILPVQHAGRVKG
ncbi:MAG: DbpA RNA binding domain-containing protein [Deltaproteobacteria bacterium]|jgi:superfamily II DNA/RNA helicase|nr:DbpA RNA binding domain-containing protein [Deltaproteobacteria bacterium]